MHRFGSARSRRTSGARWPRVRGGWLASLAAGVIALAFATNAHAYCRTTTTPLPAASFDPSVKGMCWMQGTPLTWPSGSAIPYSLSAAASVQVTLEDATRVADAAFATWNTARCSVAGVSGDAGLEDASLTDFPNMHAFDNGPVAASVVEMDCGLVKCGATVHDTNHLIVFRDTGWMHNDVNNTLALTTVTYGVNSGTIYDADIEINSSMTTTPPHFLTAIEPPPANLPPNTYDLQAILTHEAGHFFGLAHATDPTAIMYAYYQPGSIALMPDDLAGICAIYPPPPLISGGSGSHGAGCAVDPLPAPPFAPPAMAVGGLGLVAWRRRRKSHS